MNSSAMKKKVCTKIHERSWFFNIQKKISSYKDFCRSLYRYTEACTKKASGLNEKEEFC
uniref:Uncharacterized protein n=1 Tax=Romanomermis culicivorax TaxID=13658 RepID=A0A915JUD0_ROMCU